LLHGMRSGGGGGGERFQLASGEVFRYTVRDRWAWWASIHPVEAADHVGGVEARPGAGHGVPVVLKRRAGLAEVRCVRRTGPRAGFPRCGERGEGRVGAAGAGGGDRGWTRSVHCSYSTGQEIVRASGPDEEADVELGGKSTNIVFDDAASLKLAVPGRIPRSSQRRPGCSAGTAVRERTVTRCRRRRRSFIAAGIRW